MQLKSDFVFRPQPQLANPVHIPLNLFPHPLGPLESLVGTWEGTGFNTIWRPFHGTTDRFLELNLTSETIQFEAISGEIPNRGLVQDDINMFGITYLDQIKDANTGAGLHIEPGIWAIVPPTSNPAEPATVVRMASIPHGTTVLAQGTATTISGPPTILNNTINPNGGQPFAEQNLSIPTQFRSSGQQINGITQPMVSNPNSVLQAAIAHQTITQTTQLHVTTNMTPVAGGGTANTAFLGPNAKAMTVEATFWIEHVKGPIAALDFLQLQYTQAVDLFFNGLHWPHVTVGTLRKKNPIIVSPIGIDPDIPHDVLDKLPRRPLL